MSKQNLFNRREFIGMTISGMGAMTMAPLVGIAEQVVPRPPNIIIILADDQGYQDIGCYGAPLICTPRLDRMAAEGVRFTDFYVASPVCSPSRAALMTGCYPPRIGMVSVMYPSYDWGMNPEEETIADLLKRGGYVTACIGKWHLGHCQPFLPTRQGFDSYFGIPYSNDMGENKKNGFPPLPLMRDEKIIEAPVDIRNITERYTEEAVKFIRANRERQFFLYLPHTMPHVPLAVSPEARGKSKGGLYGDVIERLDWSTGVILDTLKELGIDEKTLVIYTSDNGPSLKCGKDGGSALPLRNGKATTFEGGMRVPCIARWPGHIPAGSVCRELASTIDFMPSLARLVDTKMSSGRVIDGRDILPLLLGQQGARSPHEAFFYCHRGLEAIRVGRWKLHLEHPGATRNDSKTALALYDLETDICETRDMAAERPEIVQRLSKIGQEFWTELQASKRPVGRIVNQDRVPSEAKAESEIK